MPTPRENTSIVKAPVLFRLPHLQHAAAAKATVAGAASSRGEQGEMPSGKPGHVAIDAVDGGQRFDQPAKTSGPAYTPVKPAEPVADAVTPAKPAAAQTQPVANAADESFMSRWGFEIKRSVILLAAIALLWGAWAIGQKSATVPNESNLVEVNDGEASDAESISIAAAEPTLPEVVELPEAPRVAHIVEPKRSSSSQSSTDFEPVTEPASTPSRTFPVTGSPAVNSVNSIASDFSSLSLDALEPPSNGEFYGDFDLGDPAPSTAPQPPATTAATASTQSASKPPTTGTAIDGAMPTATNFVPSATPEMPGFDPNKLGNAENTTAEGRPVLSSTPNAITDWSRYLPGASVTGPIRSVSATQTIGGSAGESESSDTQAIYLDENDPNTPNVGVAPYYR